MNINTNFDYWSKALNDNYIWMHFSKLKTLVVLHRSRPYPEKTWFWAKREHGPCEPQQNKTNKMSVLPLKTQISLGICPVWSVWSVFTVGMKRAWVLSYPLSAQRRLWSDWADAQADLSLRWALSHFVGFVMLRLISMPGSARVSRQWRVSGEGCTPTLHSPQVDKWSQSPVMLYAQAMAVVSLWRGMYTYITQSSGW